MKKSTTAKTEVLHSPPPTEDAPAQADPTPRQIIYPPDDYEPPQSDALLEPENAQGSGFMELVPEYVTASVKAHAGAEPLEPLKGGRSAKEKPSTGTALTVQATNAVATKDEEPSLFRPYTILEATEADRKIVKIGADLLRRQSSFRAVVLLFYTRSGHIQLGFKNIEEWGQKRFGIEGKGVYSELQAARTEQSLMRIVEQENEAGREVPLPNKIPANMLLALKDVPADKIPEALNLSYEIAEAQAKEEGRHGAVSATAKNVKEALVSLGLKSGRTKPPASAVFTAAPAAPAAPVTESNSVNVSAEPESPVFSLSAKTLKLTHASFSNETGIVELYCTDEENNPFLLCVWKAQMPSNMFTAADLFPLPSELK